MRPMLSTFLMLCLGCLAPAQQPGSWEVLQRRIEQLERASQRDQAEILSLQSRLAEVEAPDWDARVDEALDAAVSDGTGAVTARRSSAVEVGGQIRLRFEWRNPANYGAATRSALDFVQQRTRVHFRFRVVDDVSTFVQFQDSRNWGEEQSVVADLEGVDIHQGYVQFDSVLHEDVHVRLGRTEMAFGDQRLISPLPWHPVGIAFDGVRVWYETGGLRLDGFFTNIAEVGPGGPANDDLLFSGVYLAYQDGEGFEADFYWMYRHGAMAPPDGTPAVPGEFREHTVGVRLELSVSDLLAKGEGMIQFGNRDSQDIRAYAWALVAQYTFSEVRFDPYIQAEWTFASGDDDPTDDEFGTFDPLYGFVHFYQGFMDIFAFRNGHDIAVRVGMRPNERTLVEVAAHYFLLDSSADAWYGANGRPIRMGFLGADDEVGLEIDLHMKYELAEGTQLWAGFSHFFAGDFVEQTGSSIDMSWLFVQLRINF